MKEKPLIEAGAQKILSLAGETKFAENGIVSRTVFRSPNCRVVLFGFAAGQELSEHTSTQHALVHVLSGECEFTLAGTPHQLKAGDLLYMPPNLPHAVCATQPFSMLLTLSPAALLPEHLPGGKIVSPAARKNEAANPQAELYDGRAIPCSEMHGQIIAKWEALPVGRSFILVNDHDPVRLKNQFSELWPEAFGWQYLVKNPNEYRIQITKLKPLPAAVVASPFDCAPAA